MFSWESGGFGVLWVAWMLLAFGLFWIFVFGFACCCCCCCSFPLVEVEQFPGVVSPVFELGLCLVSLFSLASFRRLVLLAGFLAFACFGPGLPWFFSW